MTIDSRLEIAELELRGLRAALERVWRRLKDHLPGLFARVDTARRERPLVGWPDGDGA